MKFSIFISLLLIFCPGLLFSQTINLQGTWKISCGTETNLADTSILSCTICDIQKSDLPKYKNQFIMRFDTIASTVTFSKYGGTSGTTIPFIHFIYEKQMQFTLEGNYYLFSIITVGNDYILKEQNEMCYLLMEKIVK